MRPFPEYTAVSFYRNNIGTTNYQGLSFSIRQRTSRGLTYSAAYTRSQLTDIASSVFDASILTGPLTNAAVADSHNLERDRDYSTGDIPHYFGASVVWDLPIGAGRAKDPGGVRCPPATEPPLAGSIRQLSHKPISSPSDPPRETQCEAPPTAMSISR
jgi:hypothetical protein